MKTFFSTLTFLATLGLSVCALCGGFGQYLWALDLFSHFQVQYFFAALILLGCSLLVGNWMSAVLAFAVLGVSGWEASELFTPPASCEAAPGTPPLKIVSLNVHTPNTNFEAVRKQLVESNADIVFLMEINAKWRTELDSVIQSYPVQIVEPREDNFGLIFLSRVPVIEKSVEFLGRSPVPSVHVVVDWKDSPFLFYGVHTLPPLSAQQAGARDSALFEIAKLQRTQTDNSLPIVVVGDLNATNWSHPYEVLVDEANLTDSALGKGWKPTWAGAGPLSSIAIDHALYSSRAFCTLKHGTLGDIGSDHRAIAVELVKKNGAAVAVLPPVASSSSSASN